MLPTQSSVDSLSLEDSEMSDHVNEVINEVVESARLSATGTAPSEVPDEEHPKFMNRAFAPPFCRIRPELRQNKLFELIQKRGVLPGTWATLEEKSAAMLPRAQAIIWYLLHAEFKQERMRLFYTFYPTLFYKTFDQLSTKMRELMNEKPLLHPDPTALLRSGRVDLKATMASMEKKLLTEFQDSLRKIICYSCTEEGTLYCCNERAYCSIECRDNDEPHLGKCEKLLELKFGDMDMDKAPEMPLLFECGREF